MNELKVGARVRVRPTIFKKYARLAHLSRGTTLGAISKAPTTSIGSVYRYKNGYILVKHDDGRYFPWKPEELISRIV